MENFKVISAVQIKKDNNGAALESPYYQLNLRNAAGAVLESPVRVSTKYLANKFRADEVDVDILPAISLHRLVKGMSVTAVIEHKTKGDAFVATENTGLVKVNDAWVPATAGQKYEVQETGYRIDYDQEFMIDFDFDLAITLVEKAEAKAALQPA